MLPGVTFSGRLFTLDVIREGEKERERKRGKKRERSLPTTVVLVLSHREVSRDAAETLRRRLGSQNYSIAMTMTALL